WLLGSSRLRVRSCGVLPKRRRSASAGSPWAGLGRRTRSPPASCGWPLRGDPLPRVRPLSSTEGSPSKAWMGPTNSVSFAEPDRRSPRLNRPRDGDDDRVPFQSGDNGPRLREAEPANSDGAQVAVVAFGPEFDPHGHALVGAAHHLAARDKRGTDAPR